VDAGASSLRAAAVVQTPDGKTRVIHRSRLPFSRRTVAESPTILATPLRSLLRRWRVRPDELTVGSTGIWGVKAKRALHRSLRGLAAHVRAMSDVELAWNACFHHWGEGVIVIAGTGAIAFGKAAGARSVRAGGLGPLLGDEGSGFWIGKQFLKTRPEAESVRLARRPDVVRAVAALAKRAPSRFFVEASSHLIRLAERAAAYFGRGRIVPMACHGGLFSHPRLREAFASRVSKSNVRWRLIDTDTAPEITVARLALVRKKFIVE